MINKIYEECADTTPQQAASIYYIYDFLIQFACSSSKFALLLKCLSVLLHFYDDKFGLLQ